MNAKLKYNLLPVMLLLLAALFLAPYKNCASAAAGESGANELYSQCVRLYGEYKDAVKNNSGRTLLCCFYFILGV